ncbi:NAD(P)-dependent malic enzyme [Geotoga petraea]|jgi:malate dehydrogenase (oxaloacetate-decarboxylating)|uniref:Malate dehydrogenase (Oxaloacetate-decarboxylating) n=1 Tax=Geotoga petraea TaxID=28234 RepID=A0A1G6HPA9_9BACT|nr:NADP-dependent malic enzyme [Geotoga petraea]SDB96072.1 malate dehydrogenase (oxaloacetate-decarboxylating) [Geotoga petraea]
MDMREKALKEHELWRGKLEIKSKVKVNTSEDLAIAYTPGVAEPCKEIEKDIENVYKYTMKSNTIAVVTDGSAVLGLGDIGPEAALPVMEGKCVLFKEFADIDAFPICLDTNDVDEIVNTIKIISPGLGGVNLEDISAPRCFEIERRLKQDLKIPVFHDDQHGTAIIVLAGIMNSLKIIKKQKENLKVVISGAGSAGIAIAKILLNFGIKNIILTDRKGILTQMEDNWAKREIADMTNPEKIQGDLSEALINSDIFIGVSAPGIVTKEMIETMNKDAIVFAMANPVPEIMPEEAKAGGARIIGTGRSDFPNQVNNVLAFPGILKGALKARTQITEEMKIAAAKAIAEMIPEEELNEENILPKAFKPGIAENVANAVINAAEK